MALKKSDLYSSIWASCDALRGGMDASQYKDYVLFLLFIKYITDKYGDSDDFEPPVTIPAGASFTDMIAMKGKPDIGDRINKEVIAPLVAANSRLARSDFPDFNDPNKLGEGKEMVDRLTSLVAIFQKPELDFSKNRAEHDDILGDAYEYLMRHFATESGKSKGQFYTPSEVSRIIAKVIGIGPHNTKGSTRAYDPTCGSGSLLLKVAAEAGKHITLEGQEKDVTTAGLARMNMILHDFPTANILSGNTLSDPKFKDGEATLRTYDYVVANPPFSDKAWSTGLTPSDDKFQRFAWGEPPAKQGDYAYLLHILRSMNGTGKAACILPHGVLFRGNAEAVIREKLVRSGILKGIIGLPANLFYGTGIPACILVLDKENAAARKGVFLIDASKGFAKDGPKNRLRERDVHKIVDVFTNAEEHPGYSRLVPHDEIAKNDFNLNLPRYIDTQEAEDIQDIGGHLHGGIPTRDIDALADYWTICPGLRQSLFADVVPSTATLPPGMPAEYRDTHFQIADHDPEWPEEFAIISAYATTGETWTAAENEEADQALHAELIQLTGRARRVTGYSPVTLHAEPGWAVVLPFEKACKIGEDFKQDAIYFITRNELSVSYCDAARRAKVRIGPFTPRVHVSKDRPIVRPSYSQLSIAPSQLKQTIHGHPQFAGFIAGLETHFGKWRDSAALGFRELESGCHPKEVITEFSEHLLHHAEGQPLIDPYAIYQHLMDYWAATMQDDCYGISAEGWVAKTARILETDKKGKTKDKGWTCDLVPKPLIVARYFAKEQAAIEALQAELEATSASLAELEEEHGGEDGFLGQLDKIAKGEVNARLKEIGRDRRPGGPKSSSSEEQEEAAVLQQWLQLSATETDLKRAIRDAEAKLDQLAYQKYPLLSEEEIQTLVVDDKWLATLMTAIQGELDRVSQTLTSRIRLLADRYATPLPELEAEVAALAAKVEVHLKKMEGKA